MPWQTPGQSPASWLTIFLLGLLGCDSGNLTYPAGGRVAFPDGTPLDGGAVEFRSLETRPSVGARGIIQPDGTFRLTTYKPGDGAVPGTHQALVVPKRPPGHQWDEMRGSSQMATLHPKYQRFESSGLEYTVTENASKNEFQIMVQPP